MKKILSVILLCCCSWQSWSAPVNNNNIELTNLGKEMIEYIQSDLKIGMKEINNEINKQISKDIDNIISKELETKLKSNKS